MLCVGGNELGMYGICEDKESNLGGQRDDIR